MKIADLFLKTNIEVIPIKAFANGIAFYVKNGKGLLRTKYGSIGNKGLCALTFDGIPLVKFHGDEYLCPTCEKLISAGYGINVCMNKEIKELGRILNAPFVSIDKSFHDLKPLLSLLPTGYYTFSDEELFPTDGQGNFFWNISNNPVLNHATCPVYDSKSGKRSNPTPRYIVPTQSPKLFDATRVDYYRAKKDDARAIAYHFDIGSYLCALIDGHHKATAAALDGRALKTLVINAAYGLSIPHRPSNIKPSIYFNNAVVIHEDEMIENLERTRTSWGAGNRMSENEITHFLSMKNDDFDHEWPSAILKTSNKYYDVFSLAYLEWAGDLSDSRLDEILRKEKIYDESEIRHISHALFIMGNPRFVDFALAFCKNEGYVRIWYDLFILLATIKSRQVEDFFIDYLLEDEKKRPYITKIVDDYFVDC